MTWAGATSPPAKPGRGLETPDLDALAAEGTRYTTAYAMAPVRGPSLVGLLTGDGPARYGLSWSPDTLRTLVLEAPPLLTDLARAAGYRTAIVGKWNLANPAEDHADVIRDEMMWGGSYWPDADSAYAGVDGGYGASTRRWSWPWTTPWGGSPTRWTGPAPRATR